MERIFETQVLNDLNSRGLIDQCSAPAELDRSMLERLITAYAGFDATADGLHVGHLLVLLTLRRVAAAGHNVIVLIGGATSLVGDPSFRNSTRPMLGEDDVARNSAALIRDIRAVMGGCGDRVTFVDNSEWLSGVSFLGFMRDVGAEFTVARMTAMESVRGRIEKNLPVTMLEFSYMLLQAADFRELARRRGCTLQIGGSDQWGNICNGIELARRTDGRQLFGLTVPLLVSSDGTKMGKTADGAVWLSGDKLDPFLFWQFWRNVRDDDVGRFLRMFTDVPSAEAERMVCGGANGINAAKERLADEVTRIVHGREVAERVARQAAALFGGAGEAQAVDVPVGLDLAGIVARLGFAPSKSAARRLAEGGGVRIGGEKVSDLGLVPQSGERLALSVGRKMKALVNVVG